jgi:hypothetical protein
VLWKNPPKKIFASVLTNFGSTPESPKTGTKSFGTWLNRSYATRINPRHCALPTTFSGSLCSRSIFENIEHCSRSAATFPMAGWRSAGRRCRRLGQQASRRGRRANDVCALWMRAFTSKRVSTVAGKHWARKLVRGSIIKQISGHLAAGATTNDSADDGLSRRHRRSTSDV